MIDIHCHLEKNDYDNIDEIINDCKKNGLEKIVVSGHDLKSSIEAVELSKKYDNVYATIGFLPDVLSSNEDNNILELEKLIVNDKVVGIGEIGLDYYWYKDNKDEQKKLFIEQLNLAKKYNKPVIIHSRESIQDCFDILKTSNVKGAMHCFSGSVEMANEFIKIGFYISVGGVLTFKNSKNIKEVISAIPLEYILLETDSPYLTPEPYRGKKNYPYYVNFVAQHVANIKNISLEEVDNITTANANSLFDF